MSVTARFAISHHQLLDADGEPLKALPKLYRQRKTLEPLYRAMVLARQFDAKAVALQRTGRLGTYASCLGQEAIGVGLAAAMAGQDILVPSFREHAAQFLRGVSIQELLEYWGGDERGSDFHQCREDFPVSVTVGGHVPHAAGVAMAVKLRGQSRAVACVLGDGATSKGDFYEAINMAGVWQLPLLVIVSNNQWAISVPREQQSRCETLAQKAIAAGFAGEQVDGNDVLAMHQRVKAALSRMRKTPQPVLIEAITYRLADHTTADDARRYRDDAVVKAHWKFDPVARLKNHLVKYHQWSKQDEQALQQKVHQQLEAGEKAYLETPPQDPLSMFDYLYAELPDDLQQQRQELQRGIRTGVEEKGAGHD